jgi:hypothetical protein
MGGIAFKKRFVVVAAASVTLVAAGLAVGGATIASGATSPCNVTEDAWPAYTQGIPANIDPLTAAGVYMWHDVNGWHIRVTHKTDSLRTFSGQMITGGGTFSDVTAVKLEPGDAYAVSQNQRTISFLFTNYGHIDGLNFHTHCVPSITFAFQSDGVTVPPAKITIGHAGVHPKTDPFTITRVVSSTTSTTHATTTTKGG